MGPWPMCLKISRVTVNGSMAHVSNNQSGGGAARRHPPARARYQLFCSVFRSLVFHKSIGGRESLAHTRPWVGGSFER